MGGGEAGLSWPFSLGGVSLVGEVGGRLGDTGVCDLAGLTGEGVGLGVAGEGLLMEDADGVGMAENDDGILRPSRASSSLHTARLRLPASRLLISEHLALS